MPMIAYQVAGLSSEQGPKILEESFPVMNFSGDPAYVGGALGHAPKSPLLPPATATQSPRQGPRVQAPWVGAEVSFLQWVCKKRLAFSPHKNRPGLEDKTPDFVMQTWYL